MSDDDIERIEGKLDEVLAKLDDLIDGLAGEQESEEPQRTLDGDLVPGAGRQLDPRETLG